MFLTVKPASGRTRSSLRAHFRSRDPAPSEIRNCWDLLEANLYSRELRGPIAALAVGARCRLWVGLPRIFATGLCRPPPCVIQRYRRCSAFVASAIQVLFPQRSITSNVLVCGGLTSIRARVS